MRRGSESAVRRALLTWRERCGPILERLDRAAQIINPLLLVVVVLLALIDVSCFTALRIAEQHPHATTRTPYPAQSFGSPPTQVPVTGPP